MVIVPITLLMATSGCATRRYARNQAGVVNQRVSELETKTNEQMAAMSSKEQADISRVDERITSMDARITTTDSKLTDLASATQAANASAAQASQLAQTDQQKIAANTTAITALGALAANAWNYQLIEKGDVTFKFNGDKLDNDAKVALDMIIQKAKAMPRSVVELQGFTDKVGSHDYNLALSRRRAEAVARYLVHNDVPLRNINTVGLGEEAPPASLAAELGDSHRVARRVYIRVYAPATAIAGEAARAEQ